MEMKRTLIYMSAVILLSGCATQTITQGKNLSSSGIAYTEAVDKLLDVTSDKVIDFDNEELRKTRRGSHLKQMILEKNEALAGLLEELERFRKQTKILQAYFLNLQALSDSPIKNDMGIAVQNLSDNISKLNKSLDKKDGKERLTEEQKAQIGSLAGLVANAIHAKKIKNALTRDAEIIGTFLALQENQLANISSILKDRFHAQHDLFLNEKVISPYVDKTKPLPKEWSENRKKWFKTRFLNQQLDTASIAAKQLRGIWADVLQGKTDIDSIALLISDINEFVTTLEGLKDTDNAKE